MSFRKLGYILFCIGISVAVFALISDSIGIGKKGIQAAQLLLIQFGVFLTALSLGFVNLGEKRLKILEMGDQLWKMRLPISYWIILGFFVAYITLFVSPVFLNPDHRISYLNRYIPEIAPIGRDLTFATSGIEYWFSGNSYYDIDNLNYPPLYSVVFSPFLLMEYPMMYFVMTFITLGSAVVSGMILPSLIMKNKGRAVILFFFITSIFSYGMQFELERGQFNMFTFALSFLAIYLFHFHYQFRHLAYLLISVAIQIKLFPVFYILLFIKDWKDWKNNIFRFLGLGIFNIGLLFVLGYKTFLDFIDTMSILFDSQWTRPYNHSLASFIRELTSSGLGIFEADTVAVLKENASLISVLFISYWAICLLIVIGRAYKNNGNGINPDLFLVCTIGALIIPSLSIDYKLTVLPPVLALVLSHDLKNSHGLRRALSLFLVFAISLAYSYTLFSFVHRPIYLESCFPLFMIILTSVTILNVVDDRKFLVTKDRDDILVGS